MNQERINELLVEHARAGRFVVRLKGGDPYVFGRGFEEVLACAEAGVPVTVTPGVTSAFAVPCRRRRPGQPPRGGSRDRRRVRARRARPPAEPDGLGTRWPGCGGRSS
jgi:hypothetical protein